MKLPQATVVLVFALCAGAPPVASAQPSARPRPPDYALDVLRAAAADPVAALPLQAPVPRRADSWNAGVIQRLAPLMGDFRDPLLYQWGAFRALTLGAFDLQDELRKWAPLPVRAPAPALAEVCRQPWPADGRPSCLNVATSQLAAAIHALAKGDGAEGERLFDGVLREEDVIESWVTRSCGSDLPGWQGAVRSECVSLPTLRAIYEGMSGRAEALARTLLAAQARTRFPEEAGQLPRLDLAQEVTEQLILRGRLRDIGNLADVLMRLYPKLDYVRVTTPLLRAVDIQTWSGTGVANALNLLAIAARADYFANAFTPVGHDVLGLALDCRAAAIRAQSPADRPDAAAALARLVRRYEQLGQSGFDTTYCMDRLARAVGDADSQQRVANLIRKEQARAADEAEKAARDYLRENGQRTEELQRQFSESVAQRDDRARFPDATSAFVSSMRKSAAPWSRLALDDAQYREVLLENLDFSKALPESSRASLVFQRVWNIVVYVEEYRSQDR